jgi:Dyp-type peroxidase family
MAVELDLADIQGNILAGYGKLGFPTGRNILLHIDDADKNPEAAATGARRFVNEVRPHVTTALRWDDGKAHFTRAEAYRVTRPQVALNIAFTFYGLVVLGVPTRTLSNFPDAFIDGMIKRAPMLGDDFTGSGWLGAWDEIWQPTDNTSRFADPKTPHILIMLNQSLQAASSDALEALTQFIEDSARKNGLSVLEGHNQQGRPTARYQELSAIFDETTTPPTPLPIEHFGFHDGIGDPVFEGQYRFREEKLNATGNGAVDGLGEWRPLATGEFLLGYPDEAQETSGVILPLPFVRNGTFMAYRKLHQNVVRWRNFIDKTAADFGKVFGLENLEQARQLLMAKMAGRWKNGAPISKAPDWNSWQEFNAQWPEPKPGDAPEKTAAWTKAVLEFSYANDPDGVKCPFGSHVRRVNTRDSLDPQAAFREQIPDITLDGSVLNNRRRILRRGLPYGASGNTAMDEDEHGIVMFIMCADLFRQYEFVQQQWINYGLDARSGSDACPIVGNHAQGAAAASDSKAKAPKAKFVIPVDEKAGHPPFIADGLPQFVETRGGEYFFIPSLTALSMLAMGTIDPT